MKEKKYRREEYLKKIREFYHETDLIKVITGVRRCGKSSLIEVIMEELLESGVVQENIIHIDLDSRKYRKIKTADELENIIDELSPKTDKKYIFIDEIQNIKNFEEVINAFRGEGEYSIFITGSNSYLLSGELVTKLTGRYIEVEIFPLSFYEYIEMKKFYGKAIDVNLYTELNKYFQEGGFPRTITIDNLDAKKMYVTAVVDEIFEKDIKMRVKIRNTEAFDIVRNYIVNNYGATMSISSIHKALKGNGININRETISRYINELVKSKILYVCNRFDMKSKASLSGEKKYYLADTSFYFSTNTDNRINYGPALENMVFIYAKSKGYNISVGRIGKLECDFIIRNIANEYAYIQVAYSINESKKTEDREFRPLEQIKDNYAKYVLTLDSLLQKRNGIEHLNILEFILLNKF